MKCSAVNSQEVLTIPSMFNSRDYQHTFSCSLLESSKFQLISSEMQHHAAWYTGTNISEEHRHSRAKATKCHIPEKKKSTVTTLKALISHDNLNN